jgi:hypothetical protein
MSTYKVSGTVPGSRKTKTKTQILIKSWDLHSTGSNTD